MSRAVVFIAVMAILIGGSVVFYQQVSKHGLGEVVHSLGFNKSGRGAAEDELLAAGVTLDQQRAVRGTYAGVDLRRFHDLTLQYATDTAYCIEVRKSEAVYHLTGPGGVPHGGPCFA